MLLQELQKRWDTRYLKFSTKNNGIATVSLSDKSEIRSDYATIYVEIKEVSKESGEVTSVVPIGMPPVKQAGGMIRLGNTFYTLTTGLIQRDGFYLVEDAKGFALQFIQRDKLLFKFTFKTGSIKFSLKGGASKSLDTRSFLLGLGVFNSEDEYDYHMAEIKRFFQELPGVPDKEAISKKLFLLLYGPENTNNFSELLYEKTFKGFFGTSQEYKGKKVFFSYSRFIGSDLVECNDSRIPAGVIIDEEVALAMDRYKVSSATISFDKSSEELVEVDWSDNFTTKDFINALNILVLKAKYQTKVALCDMHAIYNKVAYNYYDYVADYLYDRTSEYVRKAKSSSAFSGNPRDHVNEMDFNQWISKGSDMSDSIEKGKSITSVNNSLTYYMSKYRFTKDLLRKNIDTIPDGERYLHLSYLGWVNPFITSDSEKVGLTGSFADEVDVANLRKPFYALSVYATEDKAQENEDDVYSEDLVSESVMFEPIDTYNKVIGFLERDQTYTSMLNGKIMGDWDKSTWDIYNEVKDLEDRVTDIVPGIECDMSKRYRLSNKAILQSLPMISSATTMRKGIKSRYEEEHIGRTAEEIIEDFAEIHEQVSKAYREDKNALLKSFRVHSVTVGRYKNNAEHSYDDKQDDTYYVTVELGGLEYIYKHPRYLQSPSENTRLYFFVRKPTNGVSYEPSEVVISSGTVGDVGQECNIMYGCLDGYTYEDGYIITTNLIKKLGLTTKLHFSQTIPFEGELTPVNLHKDMPSYLDEKGLPRLGTFIRKGDVLCKIAMPEVKIEYSTFTGFVESIKINSSPYKESQKEVKIYLCDISVPKIGDKFGNGHGNKGVCVRVIDSELICVDGDRQPDVVINPLGTMGRMNFGQIKEMLANTISESQEERLELESSHLDSKDIKEIVSEMQTSGTYQENQIVYNGMMLKSNVFVAPLTMYRMKQHSAIHLKYASAPSLNVNHVASNGQRMSALNTLLYTVYGCQDALKYMLTYQSRDTRNASMAENDLISGRREEPDVQEDVSVLRANAMHMARGQKITAKGPSYLTCDDVANLEVLPDNPVAIINEAFFGRAEPKNPEGYQLVAKIQVGGKIIMPSVLLAIIGLIPVKYMHGGGTAEYLSEKIVESICKFADNKIYLSASKDKSYICLYVGAPETIELVKSNYGQGYFALIEAINELDMIKVRETLGAQQQAFMDSIVKTCGYDFIQRLTLDGVPVAPVNLRPIYRGRSGQSVDSLYRTLSRAASPTAVYSALLAIDKEFKIQLYQHSAITPKRGEIAHGEKTSEYIDSIYARRYGYSGRSVATFDNDLEIFEISLPFELLYYELQRIVKEEVFNCVKEDLVEGQDWRAMKTRLFDVIDETVKNFISGKTYDKEVMYRIQSALEAVCKNIATGMTREPILRRQNHFWYKIKFHVGNSMKTHPAICAGYNLDFDGDAESNFLCLSQHYSNDLLKKMSPFEGIYDYDSGEVWLKPVQDSLLGLYKLTKHSVQEEVRKVYNLTEGTLVLIKNDVASGVVSYADTVMLVKSQTQVLKQTVGNLILLLTIRKDALIDISYCIDELLGVIEGGMTNKNNSKFIEKLLTIQEIYDDGYWSGEAFEYFKFDKFKILHVIREVMNLGNHVITAEGVTLNPSVFATVKTANDINKSLGLDLSTHEFDEKDTIVSRLRGKEPPLFTLSTLEKSKREIQELIRSSIYDNEELSDIFRSGCRGKIDDFLKVCDSIGQNVYEGTVRDIKSNYSKGLTYVDKMLLAQPDRKAVVNTQVHLGEQGAKLKCSAIVASANRIVADRCKAESTSMILEYLVYQDNELITNRAYIKVEDKNVLGLMAKLVSLKKTKTKAGYPSELVSKVLQKHSVMTLDGKPLTYKLTDVDKKIIKSHYVMIDNKEFLGSEVIKRIEQEHQPKLKIFTLYNCLQDHGICKHCYGTVHNDGILNSFRGNVGINIVFSVGQQAFQNTLDASKSTSGDISVQNQSILSIFKKGDVVRLTSAIAGEDIAIRHDSAGNTFKVSDGEKTSKISCAPYEFDAYFREHKAFLPKRFVNFTTLINNVPYDALEYQYFNMIRLLCSTVTPQQADAMLSLNMRYANNGVPEPLTDYNKGLPRMWLVENELYGMQDPMVSPLLPEPSSKFIRDALTGKQYDENGIFYGVFSLDKVDEITHRTSIRARTRDTLQRSQLMGSTAKPSQVELPRIEQEKKHYEVMPMTREWYNEEDEEFNVVPEQDTEITKVDTSDAVITNEF